MVLHEVVNFSMTKRKTTYQAPRRALVWEIQRSNSSSIRLLELHLIQLHSAQAWRFSELQIGQRSFGLWDETSGHWWALVWRYGRCSAYLFFTYIYDLYQWECWWGVWQAWHGLFISLLLLQWYELCQYIVLGYRHIVHICVKINEKCEDRI